MATLIDVEIDAATRQQIADLYRRLDFLDEDEVSDLAPILGVQPRTLQGWIDGRGTPVPRVAEGRFAYSEIEESWANRVLLAQLLAQKEGVLQASGFAERLATYDDDVGVDTLAVILDRAVQYMQRELGDDWRNESWRAIWIERRGTGWVLRVTYSREMSK